MQNMPEVYLQHLEVESGFVKELECAGMEYIDRCKWKYVIASLGETPRNIHYIRQRIRQICVNDSENKEDEDDNEVIIFLCKYVPLRKVVQGILESCNYSEFFISTRCERREYYMAIK